jgi:hypothetical protein
MTLEFNKAAYRGLEVASAVDRDNKGKRENREALVDLVRKYAPAGATDGVDDQTLLSDEYVIDLAVQSAKALRDSEFSERPDEVISSVPATSLENLVMNIRGYEIGENANHNRAYANQKRYSEAVEVIRDIQNGGESAKRRVVEYAGRQEEEVKAKLTAHLSSDDYKYLTDEQKEAWVQRVSDIAKRINSNPERVLETYAKIADTAKKEFDAGFNADYTRAQYANENLRAALGKGGKDAEGAKSMVDLMRYNDVDSPEKLAEALKGDR